eukprot:gene7869-7699_t
MPLFYPALYVTVHLRGRSLALNTIQNALDAVKALYAWQGYYGHDIESYFSRGELLQAHDRTFPLLPELVDKIRGYVLGQRNKVPGAKKHGYLF